MLHPKVFAHSHGPLLFAMGMSVCLPKGSIKSTWSTSNEIKNEIQVSKI